MARIIAVADVLVVLAWAAAVGGRSELFALLFTGVCAGVVACLAGKRSVERREAAAGKPTSDFRYQVCVSGVAYLVPTGLAILFYVLLSGYLGYFGDRLSVGWLASMQHAFAGASAFFTHHVGLTSGQVLLLLVATYLVSCAVLFAWPGRTSALERPDAGRWLRLRLRTMVVLNEVVDRYRRYCGPVGAGLGTLAAFTFFGMQLGTPSHDLRLRVTAIQRGYADIVRKVDRQVSEHLAAKLYLKVNQTFPSWYHDALALPARIDSAAENVRVQAATAQETYGVGDPATDRTVDREIGRRNAVDTLDSDWWISDSPEHPKTPEGLTLDEVRHAEAALDTDQHRAITLITEGPNRMVLHVESILSGRIMALTEPLTAHIPILRPALQAFSDAVDTSLQARIARLLAKVDRAAVDHPDRLSTTIEHDTDSLVATVDVTEPVAHATPLARREYQRLTHTLADLEHGQAVIEGKVDAARAAEAAADPDPGLLPLLPDLPELEIPPPSTYLPEYPALPDYSVPEFPEYPGPTFEEPPALPRLPPPVERPPVVPIEPIF